MRLFWLIFCIVLLCRTQVSRGALPYPLNGEGGLLSRAATVCLARPIASKTIPATQTRAAFQRITFEAVEVLRGTMRAGERKTVNLSTGFGGPLKNETYLFFSQGDHYWGFPEDTAVFGQPMFGQASYCGWILCRLRYVNKDFVIEDSYLVTGADGDHRTASATLRTLPLILLAAPYDSKRLATSPLRLFDLP